MRRARIPIQFVCDTREQWMWSFAAPVRSEFIAADPYIVRETIGEGDYSVRVELPDGPLLSIRLERKSHADLVGCVGHGRERFTRELERLVQYDRKAIIIEASAADILRGHERSHVSPRAAMASLCCWSVQFNLGIWFAETHRRAGGIAQRLLEEFACHHLKQNGTE